jgi:hypothetical protein
MKKNPQNMTAGLEQDIDALDRLIIWQYSLNICSSIQHISDLSVMF